MKLISLLAALLALAPLATATEIVVPDDQPNLQAAIAAAVPGDVIRIRTTTDQASHTWPYTTVIDKPLTIIGEPVFNFGVTSSGPFGIELSGPGHGEVTIVGLKLHNIAGDDGGTPTLSGGGFHTLNLISSSIDHDNCACSGLISHSFPAVELASVERLIVVDSYLRGGPAGSDSFCIPAQSYTNGSNAILAPTTSVLLLDSIIEGGRGSYGKEVTYEPCSSPVAQWGGRGGHGVEAANVHSINSLVTGGMGTTWFSDPFCVGIEERCGSMPDGEPFVVTRSLTSSLCSRLTQASATPSIGGNLELTWDPTTPGCQPDLTGLAGSIGLIAIDLSSPVWPIPYGSSWLFIDPNRAIVTTAIPVDHNLLIKVVIPKIPSLVGMPYTAQVLIGPTEISGPAIGRITP